MSIHAEPQPVIRYYYISGTVRMKFPYTVQKKMFAAAAIATHDTFNDAEAGAAVRSAARQKFDNFGDMHVMSTDVHCIAEWSKVQYDDYMQYEKETRVYKAL